MFANKTLKHSMNQQELASTFYCWIGAELSKEGKTRGDSRGIGSLLEK